MRILQLEPTSQPRSDNQKLEQFGEEKQLSLLRQLEVFYAFLLRQSGQKALWRLTARLTNAILRILLCLPVAVRQERCDILIIHFLDPDENAGLAEFCQRVRSRFAEQKVVFHKLMDFRQQLRHLHIINPPLSNQLSNDTFYLAPYPAFIMAKYRPSMLIVFLEWNPAAILFYVYAKRIGATVINVAHALTSNSDRCSVQSFDYYFLFGESSLEHLRKNPIRIGSAKLVQTGTINFSFRDDRENSSGAFLYFSDWAKRGYEELVESNLQVVYSWFLERQPLLYIKPHPLDDGRRVRALFEKFSNVTVLDKGIPLDVALSKVSFSVVHWSTASLASAGLGKPVIAVNTDPKFDDTFLELEEFFGPVASTPAEITDRAVEFSRDSQLWRNRSIKFARYHLKELFGAGQYIEDTLAAIYEGQEGLDYTELPPTDKYPHS